MCERTYVACASCGADTDALSYWQEDTRREYAHVDSDGDPSDFYDMSEGEPHDSGYSCASCERDSVDVDREYVPEECDCRECDPETALAEPDDEDEVVLIRRTQHGQKPDLDTDTPAEIVKLFSDRALSVVPIRAGRATELHEEGWINGVAGLHVDLTTQVPDSITPEEAAA